MIRRVALLVVSILFARSAAAETPTTEESKRPGASATVAFETNVLWPFFPGGISEVKILAPVLRSTQSAARGELLVGLHSDFATRFVRPDDRYGKVSIVAAKLGYRQFLISGLHFEASVDAGWRHEDHNVWDGGTLDAFSARLWLLTGYQQDLGERVYLNLRGGFGIHLMRTDRLAEKERKLVPGADMNLGFRF